MTSPLFSVSLPPRKQVDGLRPVLLLLHGRGTDEQDLLGLGPMLDERLEIISLRAPYRFEMGGYTWFHLSDSMVPDKASLLDSYGKISASLESIMRREDVDRNNIYLLGFSMGTMMSYLLALTKPELFAGVCAQSGFVMELPYMTYRWDALQQCPFIITHGTEDMVLPVSFARRTRDLFKLSTADVVYREYPMGHEISEESLADVTEWLTKRIDARREPGR
jgi:phospholipase/carboxylesterase